MAGNPAVEGKAVRTHRLTRHTGTAGASKRGTLRNVLSSLWLVLAFCALGLAGYEVKSGQWHALRVRLG